MFVIYTLAVLRMPTMFYWLHHCVLCASFQYCSAFADSHHVLFNPAKSHCIQFCSKLADVVQYSVQGQLLTWVESVTHLGHVLSASNDDGNNIRKRMCDFVCQANYFLTKFGLLSVIIRSKLFANFCQSYYGCQLWPLTHKCLLEFDVVWRKVIRRVWHLPRTSHNVLLPFFSSGVSFRETLHLWFCKFASSCLDSNNELVYFISKVACMSQRHAFGYNVSVTHVLCDSPISPPEASVACELAFAHEGLLSTILTSDEMTELLHDVGCN